MTAHRNNPKSQIKGVHFHYHPKSWCKLGERLWSNPYRQSCSPPTTCRHRISVLRNLCLGGFAPQPIDHQRSSSTTLQNPSDMYENVKNTGLHNYCQKAYSQCTPQRNSGAEKSTSKKLSNRLVMSLQLQTAQEEEPSPFPRKLPSPACFDFPGVMRRVLAKRRCSNFFFFASSFQTTVTHTRAKPLN